MRNKAKFARVLGAMAMAATLVTPAMAASHFENSTEAVEYYADTDENKKEGVTPDKWEDTGINQDGIYGCDVHAEIGSTFKVTLPKDITLDGKTKQANYRVECEGDISGDEYVKAAPEATVIMKQDGKEDVTGTITQATTMFRGNDYTAELKDTEALMETGADGNISAQDLSAGHWDGQFTFDVALMQDASL